MSALAFSPPIPFVNPDDMEDTGAMIDDLVERFPTMLRYFGDPDYRRALDAERDARRAEANAAFDAIRDAGLRKLGYI